MPDTAFQCDCGALKGVIKDASPATGTHAECFCDSCRAGAIYSGAADPAPAPVGIFQTSPHLITVTEGAEHLDAFAFGPRNLLRWRAACCGSPLCTTPRNPKIAFVGFTTDRLTDLSAIDPVVGQAFIPTPNGKAKHKGLAKFIWGGLTRTLGNRLSGRWRQTPFFDAETGDALANVTVVSKADRAALLAD